MACRANFLHIPKTGGTAIREALKAEIAAGTIVCHEHFTRLCDVPPTANLFFFLREPLARFVSGFNSRLRQGRPRYKDAPWTAEQALLFQTFPSANQCAEGLSSNDEKTRAHAFSVFQHIVLIRPYDYWFSSLQQVLDRRRQLLFIGLRTELDRDIEPLSRLLGLKRPMVLPRDDIGAHRAPTDADTHLSDLAVRNLESVYAFDLEFYRQMCGLRKVVNPQNL